MSWQKLDDIESKMVSDNALSVSVAGRQPLMVDGQVLEAVYARGDEVLVFATDGIDFEDALHISLADKTGSILETVTLGSIYSTGAFENDKGVGEEIEFRFFGDTDWRIKVLQSSAFHLPYFNDPKGVQRDLSVWSRLRVSGNPKPER